MENYDALRKAVKDYLDEFFVADRDGDRISWPQELEELIGWEPPEGEE